MYDYKGIAHCHSTYSDGEGTYEEIIEAANRADLDFLMMTDHHTLKPRDDGYEGWKGNALVIVGMEISPGDYDHYLAFGIDSSFQADGIGEPQKYIDKVREAGGLGFLAHPDQSGIDGLKIPSCVWKRWDVSGYTGLGVWDLMTDWEGRCPDYLRAALQYFLRLSVISGPKAEALRRWDELNRSGRVVGIGEIDNHAKTLSFLGLKATVFPYRYAFKSIVNHVLLEGPFERDSAKDTSKLLKALGEGRLYISHEYWDEADGFRFWAENSLGRAEIGGTMRLAGKTRLIAELPGKGKIRLVKDGAVAEEAEARELEHTVKESGVFRVEVYQRRRFGPKPWIFSNHIRVV